MIETIFSFNWWQWILFLGGIYFLLKLTYYFFKFIDLVFELSKINEQLEEIKKTVKELQNKVHSSNYNKS
ncbi:MAG: hypothetical protein HY808_03085 [Nitrospirae bacterium]|nr:hypothetical protein [Nitrospirota bacterium]